MNYSDDKAELDPKVLDRIVEILRALPKEFFDHDYSKRTIAVAIKQLEEEFRNER
jgi:hypothetical protein